MKWLEHLLDLFMAGCILLAVFGGGAFLLVIMVSGFFNHIPRM